MRKNKYHYEKVIQQSTDIGWSDVEYCDVNSQYLHRNSAERKLFRDCLNDYQTNVSATFRVVHRKSLIA